MSLQFVTFFIFTCVNVCVSAGHTYTYTWRGTPHTAVASISVLDGTKIKTTTHTRFANSHTRFANSLSKRYEVGTPTNRIQLVSLFKSCIYVCILLFLIN